MHTVFFSYAKATKVLETANICLTREVDSFLRTPWFKIVCNLTQNVVFIGNHAFIVINVS